MKNNARQSESVSRNNERPLPVVNYSALFSLMQLLTLLRCESMGAITVHNSKIPRLNMSFWDLLVVQSNLLIFTKMADNLTKCQPESTIQNVTLSSC